MIYFFSLLVSLLGSFFVESMSKPIPLGIKSRSRKGVLVHSLLAVLAYALICLITTRPLFSIGLLLVLVVVIVVINNTKFATLREPLAFSDFFLYLQAAQHPRLYLPFLGIFPLVSLVSGVCVLLTFGLLLEASRFSWLALPALLLFFFTLLAFFLIRKISLTVEISNQLETDCKRLGLIASLCVYAFKAPLSKVDVQKYLFDLDPFKDLQKELPEVTQAKDLVVIQSESFFDARRLSPNIKPEVLSHYDQWLGTSDIYGKLEVPAWGANTMRTEFAFLTSLTPDQIGLAQFYPYRQLIGLKVPSIVNCLKQLGYHCVCIHPHAASFFKRDKFFKQLGFDEFIDDNQFAGSTREGPYVADSAVTEKIKEVLNDTEKPCFVFAITMENHGPLHLESLRSDEWRDYYDYQPEDGLDDLTVYLRHLKNADDMINQLCDFLSKRDRESVFSFYGDHVPAMSGVFNNLDYEDPRSNYFIWSGENKGNGEGKEIRIEDLAKYLVVLLATSDSCD